MRQLPDVNINIKEIGIDNNSSYESTAVIVGRGKNITNELYKINTSYSLSELKQILGDKTPIYRKVIESIGVKSRPLYLYVLPLIGGTWDINVLNTEQGYNSLTYTDFILTEESNIDNPMEYEGKIKLYIEKITNEKIYYKYILSDAFYSELKEVDIDSPVYIDELDISLELSSDIDSSLKHFVELVSNVEKLSTDEVSNALDNIKENNQLFDHILFCGSTDDSSWLLINSTLQTWAKDDFKYMYAVCEAPRHTQHSTTSEYVNKLITISETINTDRVEVVASTGLIKTIDGRMYETSLSGIVSSLHSRSRVGESIGKVANFPISGLETLIPKDMYKYIQRLDNSSYTTVRKYNGLTSHYVTNSHIMKSDKNNPEYIENLRVLNKACTLVRKKGLQFMHANITSSENKEKSLMLVKETLSIPLEDMILNQEISDFKLSIINPDSAFTSGSINLNIIIYLQGILKYINTEISITRS